MRPKEIGIVGFENVVASHLILPADAFTAACLEDGFGGRIPCYKVWTIGLTKECFVAESGVALRPQKTLESAPPLDTIIVPGGSGLRQPQVSTRLTEWLLSRAYETRRIASICTGLYALAPTGLLDGREVTTHWRVAGDIRRRYPSLRIDHRRSLVKDGPFYTSAGLTAGIDLALALIEEDYGGQVALAVARELVMRLRPPGDGTRDFEPAHYQYDPAERVADLPAWIVAHLHETLTVEFLAERACLCPRHFSRVFKQVFHCTPADFVEELRLTEARRRLLSLHGSVESIAESVGFKSSDAFRRAFERRVGLSPSAFRRNSKLAAARAKPPRSVGSPVGLT